MATLREFREQKKLTLQDVAVSTGLHISSIHRIERGQLPKNFERSEQLAAVYGLQPEQFLAAVYAAFKQELLGMVTPACPSEQEP